MIANVFDETMPAQLIPSETDRTLARESRGLVQEYLSDSGSCQIKLYADGVEREVRLPMSALRALTEALRQIALGKAPVVLPLDTELSPQQAADLLHVSRPYLDNLLEQHEIPFLQVGAHRRIRLQDILSYKRNNDEERVKVLEELAAQAQELNMGY